MDGQPGDGAPGEGDNISEDVENVATGGGADTLTGNDAANSLDSGGGEDYSDGGGGADAVQMGAARDVARMRDGVADTVDCGPSTDFAIVDAIDVVAKSCERVDKGKSRSKLGSAVTLRPLGGGAAFGLAGMHRTVPLKDLIGVPLGTKLDSTLGGVRLTAALGGGRTQTGDFSLGEFVVKQSRSEGGLTELRLTGGPGLGTCPAAKRGGGAGARGAASHRVLRRLFGRGHGRFRSRGRYSTATVRGTEWIVNDRCDGTLTSVKRGTVRVHDLVRNRTVTLRSGQRYLARRGNR
jgi:Ca2+-binding RTX toxin-like protein